MIINGKQTNKLYLNYIKHNEKKYVLKQYKNIKNTIKK